MKIFHLTGETLCLRDSPDALRILGALLAVGGIAPIVAAWPGGVAGIALLTPEQTLLLGAGLVGFVAGCALLTLPRTTTCMVDRATGTLRVTHRNAFGSEGWGCYLSSLADVLLEPQFGADGHPLYRIALLSATGRRIPLTSYSSAGAATQMPAVAALRQFLPSTTASRATRASTLPLALDLAQWSRIQRFLYLVATALVVLVGGSAVTISSTVREAGGYRSVGVTVLTTRVETRVGRTGSLSRRPVVTYRYTVGGRVYTSERVTRGDDWRSGSWAFDVANRFAPGRRYIGFYDAANPGTAFLFKPLELVQYILALVPLVGLLVVARAIHAWRKRAPPRGPTPGGPSAVESGLVFLHV